MPSSNKKAIQVSINMNNAVLCLVLSSLLNITIVYVSGPQAFWVHGLVAYCTVLMFPVVKINNKEEDENESK